MASVTRREFLRWSGAGAFGLNTGFWLQGCATTAPAPASAVVFDPMIHVDPELRSLVPALLSPAAQSPLTRETLDASRKLQFAPRPLPKPEWTRRSIPGLPGAPEVVVYIVAPPAGGMPRPAILHIHGGGYVAGSAQGSLRMAQEFVAALDCVVVVVDYRLAPETPFPGALDDNYAALKWLYGNADDLGVDRSRIAVMGESAGGGHAAMLAIAARDRGELPLLFQALIYPMLDDRTGSTRVVPPHIGTLTWTADKNRFGWTALLGVSAGSADVPAEAVPARVENLKGLPPTFIGVGSIDLFVQEDIEYAQRLIESGVRTELHVVPGAYHGFDIFVPKASVSRQFMSTLQGALARAFGRPSA